MKKEELEELDAYELELFLFYYIYATNINKLLADSTKYDSDFIVLNDAFIYGLKSLVDENCELEILGLEEKNNIYEIINFIKTNKIYSNEEEKIKSYESYNDVIRKLNSTKDENADHYKEFSVLSRLSNRKEMQKKNIEINMDFNFGEAFASDIALLNVLRSNDDYFAKVATDFTFNEYSLLSIEKFVNDIPFLFKDEDVYIRVLTIFELNKGKLLGKEYKDEYRNNKNFRTLNKLGKKSLIKTKKTLNKKEI